MSKSATDAHDEDRKGNPKSDSKQDDLQHSEQSGEELTEAELEGIAGGTDVNTVAAKISQESQAVDDIVADFPRR